QRSDQYLISTCGQAHQIVWGSGYRSGQTRTHEIGHGRNNEQDSCGDGGISVACRSPPVGAFAVISGNDCCVGLRVWGKHVLASSPFPVKVPLSTRYLAIWRYGVPKLGDSLEEICRGCTCEELRPNAR